MSLAWGHKRAFVLIALSLALVVQGAAQCVAPCLRPSGVWRRHREFASESGGPGKFAGEHGRIKPACAADRRGGPVRKCSDLNRYAGAARGVQHSDAGERLFELRRDTGAKHLCAADSAGRSHRAGEELLSESSGGQ